MEVQKSVMANIRQLGGLFLALKAVDSQVTLFNQANGSVRQGNASGTELNVSEMFPRKKFLRLASAIEAFTKYDDGSLKKGKKISLFYLLEKAAQILRVHTLYRTTNPLPQMLQILLKSWILTVALYLEMPSMN